MQDILGSSLRAPWLDAFADIREEHGFRSLRIEGEIPRELDGTLWSNGPGTFTDVAPHERMWLDGDGAVTAIRLKNGAAEGAVRRVETPARATERKAKRRVFGRYHLPTPFFQHLGELLGTKPRRNPANTSVWVHRDRVYALCPAGLPFELDAELRTIGETSFDGVVEGTFSAHASYSAPRRGFYNFGLRFGRASYLDLYFFGDDGSKKRVAEVPLEGPLFNHDFMVTEHWAVFVLAPARFDPRTILLGRAFGEAMRWRPEEGAEVVLIRLDSPHEVVRFTIEPLSVIHFANAWEENGEIVLQAPVSHDFMRTWRWLESVAKGNVCPLPDPKLSEMRIDPKRRRASVLPVVDVVSEAPRVDPRVEMRRSRYVYGTSFSKGAAGGPPDRLVKLDARTGTVTALDTGEGTYPTEAMFVPRAPDAAEDDGWLLALVYDPNVSESCLAVLRGDEVVGRAWLGQSIPPVFHGTWKGRGDQVGPSPSSSAP
jgi:all-trans-8'-apo-beta-carotenal 15,15'-oxygenase